MSMDVERLRIIADLLYILYTFVATFAAWNFGVRFGREEGFRSGVRAERKRHSLEQEGEYHAHQTR